ncbi:MAG TPA: NUDIX domain-containing protein [Brevundimonas sp.]|uniref:NUDIX domain-containing protein n=1 Tax=Brevundimonas sp. TaxID=1871086 RepID=UPI00260CEC9C|nr:NUDIX domain-containing protein [Brevundimonas sp.]HRO34203.1 NUDIX domain-containing protein [Brevundimonas sp.]
MLQFGQAAPGADYRLRHAVFGLAVDDDGRIACVRVDRDGGGYFDLPGGAVDGDETEPEALAREFGEETGLRVRPVRRLGEAAQYFRRSDGDPVNNRGGFWSVEVLERDPGLQCEPDHALVWLSPAQAIAGLRHEAHAWAVVLWMRANG